MPIYEYQCSACGHQLEAIQKFSDAPLVDCPTCKAPQLEENALGSRLSPEGQWLVRD